MRKLLFNIALLTSTLTLVSAENIAPINPGPKITSEVALREAYAASLRQPTCEEFVNDLFTRTALKGLQIPPQEKSKLFRSACLQYTGASQALACYTRCFTEWDLLTFQNPDVPFSPVEQNAPEKKSDLQRRIKE